MSTEDDDSDPRNQVMQRESHHPADVQPRVVDLAHSLVAPQGSQSHTFPVTTPKSVELPNSAVFQSMRLAQSRARLAEDSLRRIETACRDTWHQLLLRENDRAEELLQVETEYFAITEHGKDGSSEEGTSRRHPHPQESSHVQPQLAKKSKQRKCFFLAMSPLLRHSAVPETQAVSRDVVRNLEQGSQTPAKDLSVLSHKEILLMQKDILRLRQDAGAARLARQTLEARLGGCIVFQPTAGQLWEDGAGHLVGALKGSEGFPASVGRQLEDGERRGVDNDEGAPDGGQLRQEVAELRQQTAVANRLALEAMGGAEAADAALQGVMERSQWELQQSSKKLADCERSCEVLRRSTRRLQRRVERKEGEGDQGEGRTLRGTRLKGILRRVGLAKFWAAAQVIVQRGVTRSWDFFRKHFLVPTKRLLVTAGLADAIGLGESASWGDLLSMSRRNGEGEGVAKSTLSPSPSVAWEMGPIEKGDEEEGVEECTQSGNGRKRGSDKEEPWHMVFLIYVVFTWQEVTDMDT